eukprot:CAMPEP_0113555080 /NCGR_PEP_ID=MMETSP0015_2-20120614/16514_1 /TAXON_ID=2838 /ORGANISM="Odontella" /LENGTH=188 /DNA_ID=CAMNT_0000456309 /DNA_START=177 /DNA_END=740 /DNA_ORIENTATION=- /assembly_acc=CAM_ASM_000160
MRLNFLFIIASSLAAHGAGFVPSVISAKNVFRKTAPLAMVGGSDFGSAMPEKPQLSTEERMVEAADTYCKYIGGNLGEGVPDPPELSALKDATESGADTKVLAACMYELMCEQGMIYDRDEDGILTPTQFVITENLDVPEVKSEFDYLYRYGMNLVRQGLVDVDDVKEIVKSKLIERTGKTPEEFDAW